MRQPGLDQGVITLPGMDRWVLRTPAERFKAVRQIMGKHGHDLLDAGGAFRRLACTRRLAVPFEARISALLSIFARRRHCRYRAPGGVPVMAASIEICRHEKVICGAKEAVG
jgi:hypothetical protein